MTATPDTPAVESAPWKGNVVGELRWHAELARLLMDSVWSGSDVPRGLGEPVVVVPGFLAGDRSTVLLRHWLRRIGYDAEPAGMLLNIDCSARALAALERLVERTHDRNSRPLTLVGHSRGGILGRALATTRPDLVHRVITLGSGLDDGFDISTALQVAVVPIRRFHAMTSDRVSKHGCMTQDCRCSFGQASRAPFPASVDLVSIFSGQDGLSNPRSSRVPYAHNVELTGSHTGLVVNRKVYRALGFALAGRIAELQPEPSHGRA
jgi:triacylglycerol lipase